jgi:hypothetical protein
MLFPTRLRLWILVLFGAVLVLTPSTVANAQQSPTSTVDGIVYFDQNGNGKRDLDEPLLSGIQISAPNGQSSYPTTTSNPDGSYTMRLTPGAYTLHAVALDPDRGTPISGAPTATRTIVVALGDQSGVDLGLALPPTIHDARFFPQTGYRVDSDAIWDYFVHRGGVATFGYPVSRAFPLGCCVVQIFQRQILQLGGAPGGAHELNLLDPGLLPITSLNFSTFPAYDPSLTSQAPAYGPNYGSAIITFVQQHAPDVFNGMAVDFYHTFVRTVSLQTAYPNGGGNPGLLPLLNLEIWGVPTSQPMVDPNNHSFVYLRFQRGIMHYDATCQCTQGILLADALKSVLTGQNLPADLASSPAAQPYLRLYDAAQVNAVAREPGSDQPRRIPIGIGYTDLAWAFTAR